MPDEKPNDVRAAYDHVAEEYATRIAGELDHKPLDRQLLDRFADAVRPIGPACDLGCGPGHVARYLRDRGLPVTGVDLSPAMVQTARRRNPDIPFAQGDMRALNFPDETFGGIVAFYSLIHLPPPELPAALAEIRRVLRPRGLLLLAFHIGDDTLHLDEWWGHPVSIDFRFFRPQEMMGLLEKAGFHRVDVIEREPYPEVEHQSRRAYIFAETP